MKVFDEIYRGNLWNGRESRSGPGSGSAATDPVKADLLALVSKLEIQSVADVACGDGFWMPDLPGYTGYDVAERAIGHSEVLHPERSYILADMTRTIPVKSDLVIARDMIQHLPLGWGARVLRNIQKSGSRWLLASTYVGGKNINIKVGDCFWPDMTAFPFQLGDAEDMIFDGYDYDRGGAVVRDPSKFLGLWRL